MRNDSTVNSLVVILNRALGKKRALAPITSRKVLFNKRITVAETQDFSLWVSFILYLSAFTFLIFSSCSQCLLVCAIVGLVTMPALIQPDMSFSSSFSQSSWDSLSCLPYPQIPKKTLIASDPLSFVGVHRWWAGFWLAPRGASLPLGTVIFGQRVRVKGTHQLGQVSKPTETQISPSEKCIQLMGFL